MDEYFWINDLIFGSPRSFFGRRHEDTQCLQPCSISKHEVFITIYRGGKELFLISEIWDVNCIVNRLIFQGWH